MAKDPAVLFYIGDWLTSTSEMDADCRGWYLNLILHNYDKGSLPSDVEKLAVLANVKFSEYERFKQVFEQVFKQKFEQTGEGRLSNLKTQSILKSREQFKEKRSESGKLSYFLRYCRKNHAQKTTESFESFVKKNIDVSDLDTKNEQVLEQVFEHLFELYRNENENENKDRDEIESEVVIESKDEKEKEKESVCVIKNKEKEKEVDKEKKEIKVKAIPKKKYGEYKHVLLTEEEYERFVKDYGLPDAQGAIKILDEYVQMKGAKYKDYNLTLRKWPVERVRENRGETLLEKSNKIKRELGMIP